MKLNKITKVLLFADMLWIFGEGMLGPFFAVFTQKIGGDLLEIAGAWSAYLIVSGFFIFLIGRMSDSYKKSEEFMVAGFFLNAIFTFGYLFVNTPVQLLLVQAGQGFAMAMATPTWNALYDSSEKEEKKESFVWSLSDGTTQLLTGIAILIGGIILTYTSFTTLFFTMAAFQTIAAIYLLRILKY